MNFASFLNEYIKVFSPEFILAATIFYLIALLNSFLILFADGKHWVV